MMEIIKTGLFLFISISFLGCEGKPGEEPASNCQVDDVELLPGEELMRVNHYKEACEHWVAKDATCFLVQKGDQLCSEEWSYFFDDEISGFQFEEGYVYLLKVRVEKIPEDSTIVFEGPDKIHFLVEVLSQQKVN